MKQDAQVVLYRSYRHGDLPDIQIQHSSLITPLQAVAQVCPDTMFYVHIRNSVCTLGIYYV